MARLDPRSRNLQRWAAPLARPSILGRCGPVGWASTPPAPASRRFPAVVPCSETTLWWRCPRATRAMGRSPLRRMAGLSRLGRLLSRVTARTVVGPLMDRPPWCVGRKDALGPVLPCARFAGRPRRRVSQRLEIEDWITIPGSRGSYTTGTRPHHVTAVPKVYNSSPSPQALRPSPQPPFCYSQAAPNWPKSQIRLAALDAPRRRIICPRAFASHLTPL